VSSTANGRSASPEGEDKLAVDPGVALLAVTLGAFIVVPPIVSIHRTFGRIAAAERIGRVQGSHFSKGLGWLLVILAFPFAIVFLVLPFWTAYAQSHLNALWEAEQKHMSEHARDGRERMSEQTREPAVAASEDPAIQIVRERYARGEMTREEFQRAVADLAG
jgi:putative oligomerization/nucleic acid binding protein